MKRWYSLLLPAALLTAALTGCESRDIQPVNGRIVILGFDGMDPELARRWMDDGSLPNFKRLAERGGFRPLQTSNPPQSPVAWSSFATGTGPGEHGIYDFLRRDAETYAPDFSISEVKPAENVLKLFGLALPLDSGQIINRRQGRPFWSDIEADGAAATVLRVPVTYPPEPVHRMLSGMGVPDLLGTQGTYTLFTTQPVLTSATSSSTRTVRMRPNRDGLIETVFEGPPHPLSADPEPLSVPLLISRHGESGTAIRLDKSEVNLEVGEWSEWLPLNFKYAGLASIPGMVRLHLVAGYPRVRLYVSPIHIDPREPVVPISSPAKYAGELAESIGLYHTIGMPEETWSLNEGHISDAAFLDVIRTTLKEREAMFFDALDRQDSHVVTGVFVQTDRVSHMFYRGIDPSHPLYPDTDAQARGAIRWIYREADRILGQTLERIGPQDKLIVVSDHGFAPFRWAVNLNRWLVDHGYLVLKDGQTQSGPAFAQIDWSRSKAYALGLNGLFLNRQGREAEGIVDAGEAAALKARLKDQLESWDETGTGRAIIREVFDGEALYAENANGDAPDLVVGYEPGYRASWQTTLGAVPAALIEPNARKWSGDHCVTPEAVPGVLFTSFRENQALQQIGDIADYVRTHWADSNAPTR